MADGTTGSKDIPKQVPVFPHEASERLTKELKWNVFRLTGQKPQDLVDEGWSIEDRTGLLGIAGPSIPSEVAINPRNVLSEWLDRASLIQQRESAQQLQHRLLFEIPGVEGALGEVADYIELMLADGALFPKNVEIRTNTPIDETSTFSVMQRDDGGVVVGRILNDEVGYEAAPFLRPIQ